MPSPTPWMAPPTPLAASSITVVSWDGWEAPWAGAWAGRSRAATQGFWSAVSVSSTMAAPAASGLMNRPAILAAPRAVPTGSGPTEGAARVPLIRNGTARLIRLACLARGVTRRSSDSSRRSMLPVALTVAAAVSSRIASPVATPSSTGRRTTMQLRRRSPPPSLQPDSIWVSPAPAACTKSLRTLPWPAMISMRPLRPAAIARAEAPAPRRWTSASSVPVTPSVIRRSLSRRP